MSAKRSKTSLSQSSSIEELGEYWDSHDVGDVWDSTRPVELEVDLKSRRVLLPLPSELADRLRRAAKQQGLSTESLLQAWAVEKHV